MPGGLTLFLSGLSLELVFCLSPILLLYFSSSCCFTLTKVCIFLSPLYVRLTHHPSSKGLVLLPLSSFVWGTHSSITCPKVWLNTLVSFLLSFFLSSSSNTCMLKVILSSCCFTLTKVCFLLPLSSFVLGTHSHTLVTRSASSSLCPHSS